MSRAGSFYEFFAGGGMARAGLGERWRCLFANDFDYKKSRTYARNWGDDVLRTVDVRALGAPDLPGRADLAWASFPCQDLSLAGGGAGLRGDRSGTFWPFWELIKGLIAEQREPHMIVIENVCGTLTSHGGKDFAAICAALPRGRLPLRGACRRRGAVRSAIAPSAVHRRSTKGYGDPSPNSRATDRPGPGIRERCGPRTGSCLLPMGPTGSGGVSPSRRHAVSDSPT